MITLAVSISSNVFAQLQKVVVGASKYDSVAVKGATGKQNAPVAPIVQPGLSSADGSDKAPAKQGEPVYIYPNPATTSFKIETPKN